MCIVVSRAETVMKNGSVENALRWMLAVWMLLATSVTPSTYVHGHRGGSVSHQHDGPDYALSHAQSAAFHDGHDAEARLTAVDVHRHGCLALLGGIAYQPLPGGPAGSHGVPAGSWETMVAISAAHSIRSTSKSLVVDHDGLVAAVGVSMGCVCESKQPASLDTGIAPASPLCDRARHERSGVLLA